MKIITPLPNKCYVAVSGGIDSMAVEYFLRQGKKDVTWLYFNHGTDFGWIAEGYLLSLSDRYSVPIHVGRIKNKKPNGESTEKFWRDERYRFLDQFSDYPVITCHHMDDQIEQLVFSFLNGSIRPIPYRRGNYIRPFLKVSKKEIKSYVKRHKVEYLDDPSNDDCKYRRNRIRHKIVPELLKINPGLHKTMLRYC